MKSSTESLSPTRVKLTIEVPFEEFKPSLQAAYKTIGSQITIPGFRKGKIPDAIVDQRIGRPAVLDEAINTALPGWYSQALQDSKIQPLSQPDIDLTKFVDGEPIEITAELDVRPELVLPDVSKIAVTVDDAAVSDDDVDEQIEELRKRFATFTEVERAAADGDFVTIDLSASQNGTPIEAGAGRVDALHDWLGHDARRTQRSHHRSQGGGVQHVLDPARRRRAGRRGRRRHRRPRVTSRSSSFLTSTTTSPRPLRSSTRSKSCVPTSPIASPAASAWSRPTRPAT